MMSKREQMAQDDIARAMSILKENLITRFIYLETIRLKYQYNPGT